jgi:hypothetical protein
MVDLIRNQDYRFFSLEVLRKIVELWGEFGPDAKAAIPEVSPGASKPATYGRFKTSQGKVVQSTRLATF